MLDAHVEAHGWTLVRISYDQFSYKDGGRFSEACLRKLFELLLAPVPGVHRIGEAYAATGELERQVGYPEIAVSRRTTIMSRAR